MSLNENSPYNLLNEKETQELLTLLVSHKTSLKIHAGDLVIEGYILPTSNTRSLTFIKTSALEFDVNNIKHSELNCHFTHKNDMYSFKSEGQLSDNNLQLTLPKAIYKLQRRENFRVYVSTGAPVSVELVEITRYKAQLNNISLSGCQIALKEPSFEKAQMFFQTDSPLKVKVQLFDFVKTFECKIKFVEKSEKAETILLGLSFEDLNSEIVESLQAAIFKLDRHNRQIKD